MTSKTSLFTDTSKFTLRQANINPDDEYYSTMKAFDNDIFNNKGTSTYGSYFLYTLQEDQIDAVVFANYSQSNTLPAFSNLMHQQILR